MHSRQNGKRGKSLPAPFACLYIYVYTYIYIIYTHMCVLLYLCIYIYIHVYIQIFAGLFPRASPSSGSGGSPAQERAKCMLMSLVLSRKMLRRGLVSLTKGCCMHARAVLHPDIEGLRRPRTHLRRLSPGAVDGQASQVVHAEEPSFWIFGL